MLTIPVGSRQDILAARIEVQQELPIFLGEPVRIWNLPLSLVLPRHDAVVEDAVRQQILALGVRSLDVPLGGDALYLVEPIDHRVLELDHLTEIPVGPLMTIIGRATILHRLELEDLDGVQVERRAKIVILHHVPLEHTVPHLSD